jgi:hypothetical protein
MEQIRRVMRPTDVPDTGKYKAVQKWPRSQLWYRQDYSAPQLCAPHLASLLTHRSPL